MEYIETIVVGGGPAGSSCAWQLRRQGRDVLVLDKQTFPRLKLCAGWVPASVLKSLQFSAADYPYSILPLKTKMYFAPLQFPVLGGWAAPWRTDYSIRRVEFDHWLLERSQARVLAHKVNKIERREDQFVIDGQFACKYLVGAGGTGCPVRRQIFEQKRSPATQICTLEIEFEYPQRDEYAHLFFLFNGLRGYSWYVPKGNGFVNLGIAGRNAYFARSKTHIRDHFQWFLANLVKRQLLDKEVSQTLQPSGHGYYLFDYQAPIQLQNCFLVGDSAGLASKDLGEGIGPAVESGLLAADTILKNANYDRSKIPNASLNPSLQWLQYIWG